MQCHAELHGIHADARFEGFQAFGRESAQSSQLAIRRDKARPRVHQPLQDVQAHAERTAAGNIHLQRVHLATENKRQLRGIAQGHELLG